MRFGFPGLDNVRSLDDFVLSYDRRNRTAHWVFEHLTPDSIAFNKNVDRSLCEFGKLIYLWSKEHNDVFVLNFVVEDASIHPFFRSSNSDYKGSGFDRGHLAAAGNHKKDLVHCQQTFLLSNMAPQVGKGFNRDSWNRLENHARKLTKENRNVYVCTGPLYLPRLVFLFSFCFLRFTTGFLNCRKEGDGKLYVKYQVLGKNHVAVPTHFFKVIVMENLKQELAMEAYVMPNEVIDDNTPLHVFLVPPETIERAAGLLFFDKISRDKLKTVNGKTQIWV